MLQQTMTRDESVTVKGSPVRSLQKFLQVELTPAQHQAMLESLPAEFSSRMRGPILPTETLPVNLINRMTEEAARAKGESIEQFARRAGREAAELSFGAIRLPFGAGGRASMCGRRNDGRVGFRGRERAAGVGRRRGPARRGTRSGRQWHRQRARSDWQGQPRRR